MFGKKKKEIKSNIPICSLLDANAKVRTFFDVEADWDKQFPVLYFQMYDIKDKKKKRMSDIIVGYKKQIDDEVFKNRTKDLKNLIIFLKDWESFEKVSSNFYLDCDCFEDLFKFTKLKKEYFKDKEDNMYIDFFSSGGNFKKKQTIEVNITKDQALVLAEQLENFLTKNNIQLED